VASTHRWKEKEEKEKWGKEMKGQEEEYEE
jgi:hypothetical protein